MDSLAEVRRLMIVERDPVFRSGLLGCLSRFPEFRIVAEAESIPVAWRNLAEQSRDRIDAILIGVGTEFAQQVKAQYPTIPILLIEPLTDLELRAAFEAGIEGYCPKGSSIAEFVSAIRQITTGQNYWRSDVLEQLTVSGTRSQSISVAKVIRQNWRLSGLSQIEAALNEIEAQLRSGNLSTLDRLFLTGRKRELKAARWLVQKALPSEEIRPNPRAIVPVESAVTVPEPSEIVPEAPQPKAWQGEILDQIAEKLQSNLDNLTNIPLEIDILRSEKKRELFFIILRQLEELLDELRFSQIQPDQFVAKQSDVLRDLWQAIVMQFFGRYSMVRVKKQDIEIVASLLNESNAVQTQILDQIPLTQAIFEHLLFEMPLIIDQTMYEVGTIEARDRAIDLLENLMIQMANAVIQPLLNRFANLEAIKQGFYDRRLLSTREIERFRNDLSWRFRTERYFTGPKLVFESRYRLFVLTQYGIDRIVVYSPRTEELESLSGVQLAVTLALETRDAISPRLRGTIAFFGSGIVYILTEIIGRGIGLIGRGILKGIGKSVRG
ncbi:response regulator receiver domain protein [Leptolyngbya sp. NIES-3755]|nr:response regulator receiver domain protein [Leptolyngbya sp. NIES-3755]